MTILMYVMSAMLVLLFWEYIREFLYELKTLPRLLKRRKAYNEYAKSIGSRSFLDVSLSRLRKKLASVGTGFLYGIGFCLAVWWLFPWLYQ